ncbi:hypothetical protein TOT_010000510 [Theileria orientalis strain Shintoku]|uniref:Uncharacterized protein n=1 Tax=Theileria orientalis strain Shintoku TaxID=869250 RepID=J4CCA4_THEOR|nr:hypothetical protein TOT_010000510 [Theileria orientalis strain Shintoku]BAM39047.1 hypothetical protein TOT_010000510 [Theileria orientalis strain Shintoku]|eukprot:XP_009689348.1 hypothetical protein TOT_010000510 [Theileria orientalis strain Shintoku]
MCASVNRNKPVQKRPGSAINSSRRSSIASSARSAKSARSNRAEELHKLLNERQRPIANFQVPTVEHKKDLHAPHLSAKTHLASKPHSAAKPTENKKTEEKDKKSIKKVKKSEGKGFFHRLFHSFKNIFA